jgi:hypothetical protein
MESCTSLNIFERLFTNFPRSLNTVLLIIEDTVGKHKPHIYLLMGVGMLKFALNADLSVNAQRGYKPLLTMLNSFLSPAIISVLFSVIVVLFNWFLLEAQVLLRLETILLGFEDPPVPLYPFAIHALKHALEFFWGNLLIYEALVLYMWVFTETSIQNVACGYGAIAAVVGATILISVTCC